MVTKFKTPKEMSSQLKQAKEVDSIQETKNTVKNATNPVVNSDNKPHLWNPNIAAICCLILPPAFGAWINKKNWEELNEPELAKESTRWIYFSIAFMMFIPFFFPTGKGAITILLAWYFISCKKQSAYLKNNSIDYIKKPWFEVVSLAVLIFIPIVAIAITFTYFFGGLKYI